MADDRPASAPSVAADRVFAVTRWVSAAILPFLLVAAFLLAVLPDRTGELFAWQIDPPLSAYVLASAYLGGLWFFARVVTAARWHEVAHGFPAVVVFAGLLLIATLVHLDRFSDNLSFAVWTALYATTPVVVAALAVAQRHEDPEPAQRHDATEVVVPRGIRVPLVVIGALAFLTGVTLFVAPEPAVDVWAWTLTPLTARVTGAVLTLTGVVNVAMLRDGRWSAFRILFQAQLLSLAAIGVSLLLRAADLHGDRPMTPLFLSLVSAALVAYGAVVFHFERRRRRAARRR